MEQPVETGDVLNGGKGRGVICKIASATEVRRYIDDGSVPDVLVAPNHVWLESGLAPAVKRLARDNTSVTALEANARATGPFSLVDRQPIQGQIDGARPQAVDRRAFCYLFATNAPLVAHELISRREHASLEALYKSIMEGRGVTRVTRSKVLTPGVVHHLLKVLSAARININTQQSRMLFDLRTDAEVIAASSGEVSNGSFLTRTFRPERGGFFCARIFGPIKDYECLCGKYKRKKYSGLICDKCGVEVTQTSVRYDREAHINLATRVVHPWLFKLEDNFLARTLDVKCDELDNIIYRRAHVVASSQVETIKIGQIVGETQREEVKQSYGEAAVTFATGGEENLRVNLAADIYSGIRGF